MFSMPKLFILLLAILLVACTKNQKNNEITTNKINQLDSKNEQKIINEIKQYTFQIIDTLPHLTSSFTQGLVFHNGVLYEGTGLNGHSKLQKINPKTGKITNSIDIDSAYFGEGITVLGDKIYQITWHDQICLIYDKSAFKLLKKINYFGEGWGLTSNDSLLILSDGSAVIKFIKPVDFSVTSTKLISYKSKPMQNINELELVGDKLYANIWGRDLIIIADINTGNVVGELDISPLRPLVADAPEAEVSNGIAYNKTGDVFYLTGKNWSKIFVVKINEK